MTRPDIDLKRRDQYILGEYAKDPTLSASELRDILEEEYDIDVSRVTVSESLRKIREGNVFREAVIPNEEYLFFSLFQFQFFPRISRRTGMTPCNTSSTTTTRCSSG